MDCQQYTLICSDLKSGDHGRGDNKCSERVRQKLGKRRSMVRTYIFVVVGHIPYSNMLTKDTKVLQGECHVEII